MPNIHSDMTIVDILNIKPKAEEIMFDNGILSENKEVLAHETLREVCNIHGLKDKQIKNIIEEIIALPN